MSAWRWTRTANRLRARPLRVAFALTVVAGAAGAQAGDRAGESQPDPPEELQLEPEPALSPADELATFRVPSDVVLELVAAEPLVRDPVAIAFDADGRMAVCELTGFMRDVDGSGEDAPIGAVALLTDTDGDGVFDARSTLLDELVLPRAVAPARDGWLVLTPPELWFVRDDDGDGRAETRRVLARGLGGIVSPEHAINGLLYAHENAYVCANSPLGWRYEDGAFTVVRDAGGGQWGLTKDDEGRLYFDTNSDALRYDAYASRYALRNPSYGRAPGINLQVVSDQSVRPIRPTPGVNRAYREGLLRADGTLSRTTGACAPLIVRGDGLPRDWRGDALVCEPCGNLVKRYALSFDDDGRVRGVDAYDRLEALASTDERFRPVNLSEGPDGALYVVDMYRGVIQHRLFVTSYLRRQIEARQLATPIGRGRIWRLRRSDTPVPAAVKLGDAGWEELGDALAHPRGTVRDTAQRLFVEEGADDPGALEVLRARARAPGAPLGRLHALWALAGCGRLEVDLAHAALGDPDERVRRAALRVAEPLLGEHSGRLVLACVERAQSSDPRTRLQALLSLGEARTARADAALARVAIGGLARQTERGALLSGLGGRELEFLAGLFADRSFEQLRDGHTALVHGLARCVVREGADARISALLTLAAVRPVPWQTRAVLTGVVADRPKPRGEVTRYVRVERRPRSLDLLLANEDRDVVVLAHAVADALAWPGREGVEASLARPLDAAERTRFEHGRRLFDDVCSSCHLSSGLGDPGKAPSLRESALVLGAEEPLVRVLLHGLAGPPDGGFDDMPAFATTDADVAAVATYLRRAFGHDADPVTAASVASVRAAHTERMRPWTRAELDD